MTSAKSPTDTLRQIVMKMHIIRLHGVCPTRNELADLRADVNDMAEAIRALSEALLSERAPLNQLRETREPLPRDVVEFRRRVQLYGLSQAVRWAEANHLDVADTEQAARNLQLTREE